MIIELFMKLLAGVHNIMLHVWKLQNKVLAITIKPCVSLKTIHFFLLTLTRVPFHALERKAVKLGSTIMTKHARPARGWSIKRPCMYCQQKLPLHVACCRYW